MKKYTNKLKNIYKEYTNLNETKLNNILLKRNYNGVVNYV